MYQWLEVHEKKNLQSKTFKSIDHSQLQYLLNQIGKKYKERMKE